MFTNHFRLIAIVGAVLLAGTVSRAEVKDPIIDHNEGDDATPPKFTFKHVPALSGTNAASAALFTLVDGQVDDNSGGIEKLNDGKLPSEPDEPAENFFFDAGTEGGRILVDLRRVLDVGQVDTFSCHPNTRGPQIYTLYASDGTAEGFNPKPKRGTDPRSCGWKLVKHVDTGSSGTHGGGQYGVSIIDSEGTLGRYRYLLFDMERTESDDDFGNTFYSEIAVVEGKAGEVKPETADSSATESKKTYQIENGKYQVTIDTSKAPELAEWADKELSPMVVAWYPKIVQMLPSDGYSAPSSFSIVFQSNMRNPAATGGSRIMCSREWFKSNLKGEAKGAVLHEMVHVIQHYHRVRGEDSQAERPPGWLVEGIPDYIRWFQYEPQSHGADVAWMRTRRNLKLSYDGMYRITANFLNWVSEKYDTKVVLKVNAALRDGKYKEQMWKDLTGHTVQELGADWKKDIEAKLAQPAHVTASAETESSVKQ